jgi:hypothetical protein
MKKFISKIILIFSILSFILAFIEAVDSGMSEHIINDMERIIALFVVPIFFLGLYRIIDLLESKDITK